MKEWEKRANDEVNGQGGKRDAPAHPVEKCRDTKKTTYSVDDGRYVDQKQVG